MGYSEELNFALAMFNVKYEHEIEKVLCDIKNRYPDKFESYFYLGTIEIRRGNFDKAAKFMKKHWIFLQSPQLLNFWDFVISHFISLKRQ